MLLGYYWIPVCKLHFPMSFQFVRVCDILLYGLNDIFAYVGSIHKTYLLSVIKFVAATTSLLEAFVKSFQKKTEIFTKKIKPYSLEKSRLWGLSWQHCRLILKFTVADCIGNHIIFCYFGELLIYVRRRFAKIAILF